MGDYCLCWGSVRNNRDYFINPENNWVVVKMKGKDVLNLITFLFTIMIVLYGLSKGFDTIELSLNLIYFTVLILSQLENLRFFLKRR